MYVEFYLKSEYSQNVLAFLLLNDFYSVENKTLRTSNIPILALVRLIPLKKIFFLNNFEILELNN